MKHQRSTWLDRLQPCTFLVLVALHKPLSSYGLVSQSAFEPTRCPRKLRPKPIGRLVVSDTFLRTSYRSISSSSDDTTISYTRELKPKLIRRVAIVGAGISGLSLAHSLVNSGGANVGSQHPPFDISIFDSRSELDATAGAGVQLNGGLAVLGKINPDLQRRVIDAGLPQKAVRSRCRSWFSDPTSKKYDTLFAMNHKDEIQASGGLVADNLISEDGNLLWISIMRGSLQKELYNALPPGSNVAFNKRLTQIKPYPNNDGLGAKCEFADGTEAGPFDLVVGCDGIRSAVKSFVDAGSVTNASSSASVYSGLRIRYAVADGNSREESSTLTQYFANGAYALHGIYGAGPNLPTTRCAFVVYLDENYLGPFRLSDDTKREDSSIRIGENADWSQDVRKPVEVARANMMEQLVRSGIPDQDNDLGSVIADATRFFELGSYFHSPFSRWSRPISDSNGAYAVLCGDAAHALPPFLGQGANQAIQDSYCLARKLVEFNQLVASNPEKASIRNVLTEYQNTRWPATMGIFWKSAFLGYLETGGSNGIYGKFRDVFFKSMGAIGVAKKVLFDAATPKV